MTEDAPSVPAAAFDPSNPAALVICPSAADAKNDGGLGTGRLSVFLSHDGTGISGPETTCLSRCLDARDAWSDEVRAGGGRTPRARLRRRRAAGTGRLSLDYRAALAGCIGELQGEEEAGELQGEEEDPEAGEEPSSLRLLAVSYGILHLAEVCLLPPPDADSDAGADPALPRRIDGPPGSLTADLVRYLRLHHGSGDGVLDHPAVLSMLSGAQPEYHAFGPGDDEDVPDALAGGPYGGPYWNLLLLLVRRGRLYDAWTVLTYHSGCARAQREAAILDEGGDGGDASDELAAWGALRAVLLAAPLPGGRGDAYDDDSGIDDTYDEADLDAFEAARLSRPLGSGDGGGGADGSADAEEPPEGASEPQMDGVYPNSHLLWEHGPRRSDRIRTMRLRRDLVRCGKAGEAEDAADSLPAVPESFRGAAAWSHYRQWRSTLGRLVGDGTFRPLTRRFGPLDDLLGVLLGKSPEAAKKGCGWSDLLLAELLYGNPLLSPGDVPARARAAMRLAGATNADADAGPMDGALRPIFLDVAGGNAGRAVEAVYALCGGSAGAALPAALTSLLHDLLRDAGRVEGPPSSPPGGKAVDLGTELALGAAEGILSSFAGEGLRFDGVRLAVRFLLPHAPPRRDANGAVVHEPRFASAVASAVDHFAPTLDVEVSEITSLCRPLVALGSVEVAEACERLAFRRACAHVSGGGPHGSAYWLLRGMEVVSSWLPVERRGGAGYRHPCRSHFDMLCGTVACNLIVETGRMMGDGPAAAAAGEGGGEDDVGDAFRSALRDARGVLELITEEDGADDGGGGASPLSALLRGHPELNLLGDAVRLGAAAARGDAPVAASCVVSCLEARALDGGGGGGAVTTRASSADGATGALLDIALRMLRREDLGVGGVEGRAFTVREMGVLMSRCAGHIASGDGTSVDAAEVRCALSRGLLAAALAGGRGEDAAAVAGSKGGTVELTLDEEVEIMLGPCI